MGSDGRDQKPSDDNEGKECIEKGMGGRRRSRR